MSELALKNAMAYFNNHDPSQLAEDVVFTVMGTGQEYHGQEEVGQMLNYFYHVVFDAGADIRNIIFTEDHVTLEATIVGKQLLEVGGIPPRDGEVRVPFCGVYDIENDRIVRARLYIALDVLRNP